MTGWILGEIGRVDEGLPVRIHIGGRIVVLVAQLNGRNRPPKIVEVFTVPASDLSICERNVRQCKHAGRIANIGQISTCYISQRILPQQWATIGPEVADVGLLRGARCANQRADCFYFVEVCSPCVAGQIRWRINAEL